MISKRIGSLLRNSMVQFLQRYCSPRALLRSDFGTTQGRTEVPYQSEETFWRDVRTPGALSDMGQVYLERFKILPWIPLTPGQYYSPAGQAAQHRAERYVIEKNGERMIYDPFGKGELVRGGLGCIRLAPRIIGGERIQFLCATSSSVADGGILLALTEKWYEQIVGALGTAGGVVCDISGRLRYWTPDERLPFEAAQGAPRLYLHVDRIGTKNAELVRAGDVTATSVISFWGNVERRTGRYFSLATFDPADRSSLVESVHWLEREYVAERYQGHVLTDFDETVRWFSGVRLPITTLMNQDVNLPAHLTTLAQDFGLDRWQQEAVAKYVINIAGSVTGLAIGDGARVIQKGTEDE
jgi:hypothetical protein